MDGKETKLDLMILILCANMSGEAMEACSTYLSMPPMPYNFLKVTNIFAHFSAFKMPQSEAITISSIFSFLLLQPHNVWYLLIVSHYCSLWFSSSSPLSGLQPLLFL